MKTYHHTLINGSVTYYEQPRPEYLTKDMEYSQAISELDARVLKWQQTKKIAEFAPGEFDSLFVYLSGKPYTNDITGLVSIKTKDCDFTACQCTPSNCKNAIPMAYFVEPGKVGESQNELWNELQGIIERSDKSLGTDIAYLMTKFTLTRK